MTHIPPETEISPEELQKNLVNLSVDFEEFKEKFLKDLEEFEKKSGKSKIVVKQISNKKFSKSPDIFKHLLPCYI